VQLLKGDPAAASKAYQSAALLAPNNPDVYYLLASALEKDGNKDGAKKALQKFVEMSNGQDARVTNARTKLSAWGN
jgi:Flp pilus assembly protein TadD